MVFKQKKSHFGLIWGVVAIGCLSFVGCNQGPRPVEISGTVTYQGKPVAEGRIFFVDVNNSTGTASGIIKDGRYETEAFPGEKRVRVNAPYKTGRMIGGEDGGMESEEIIDLLPPKYNTSSELICTVAPEGEESLDFPLK